MANCLIDTIGLIGCGSTSPASGLFLNSLAGISLKTLEKISDEEQKDYMGVWDDIQTRAARRISMDVIAKFGKRFKLNSIPQSFDLGTDADTINTTSASTEFRGLVFDLDRFQYSGIDAYKDSALQSHHFQVIKFYSLYNADTTFYVKDYNTGTTLDTFTKTCVIGWNIIASNKDYSNRRITLEVNADAIDTVTLSVPNNINWCSTCCGAWVDGIKYTTLPSEGTKGRDSAGFSVIYSVRCKFDNVICNNLDLFYNAWWYLLGSETMTEALFSKRINPSTLNRKDNEELKALYDTEYEKALEQICHSINLSEQDCCLECDSQYNIKEAPFH